MEKKIEKVHWELTDKILKSCIEVHKVLGPGFLERLYEEALCLELESQNIKVDRQITIPISYKGEKLGIHRLDLVVENTVLIELKACSLFKDIHFATILSYLKASGLSVGLLLNFATPTLGIKRFARSICRNNDKGILEWGVSSKESSVC